MILGELKSLLERAQIGRNIKFILPSHSKERFNRVSSFKMPMNLNFRHQGKNIPVRPDIFGFFMICESHVQPLAYTYVSMSVRERINRLAVTIISKPFSTENNDFFYYRLMRPKALPQGL